MRVRLVDKPNFSICVVGCGGGPDESNLSSYLCKRYDKPWSEGCFALEGGSGIGAIARLLSSSQTFQDFSVPETLSLHERASYVLSLVKAYVISHAHFDHISGMVLSAGAFSESRPIFGSMQTLQNLSKVFDGGIWPRLASWEDEDAIAYVYKPLLSDPSIPLPGISVQAMPISHGMATETQAYESTAIFVSTPEVQQFLFFGDVGPDSLSNAPRNTAVWREAAYAISHGRLSTIFIECSYPADRDPEVLYGHLSPPYLFEELQVLARELQAYPDRPSKPLSGLNICIIHIKDCTDPTTGVSQTAEVIERELLELEETRGLGARFLIVKQGMTIDL